MPTLKLRSLLAVLLTVALSACGSKEPAAEEPAAQEAAAPAAQVDACELFTQEDAQAIAGESVSFMSSTLEDARGRDPLQCAYNAGNTDNPRILSLLLRRPHESAEQAAGIHEATRSSLEKMTRGDLQPVPGLGDDAFWAGGNLQQLHVLSGRHRFIATALLGEGADSHAAARRIADVVLARLKEAPEAPASP